MVQNVTAYDQEILRNLKLPHQRCGGCREAVSYSVGILRRTLRCAGCAAFHVVGQVAFRDSMLACPSVKEMNDNVLIILYGPTRPPVQRTTNVITTTGCHYSAI
jgi:LSD1 subclass zinc finger protein